MKFRSYALAGVLLAVAVIGLRSRSAAQEHGRKYKPPPPTARVVVTVVKKFDGKPIMNAGVVFHAIRDGKDDGNLEVKTDPNGHATIDVLEVGSHVLVQVIANGFATAATDFQLTGAGKSLLVKMQEPRAQVSEYEDNNGKPAQVKPGVQVHIPGTLPQSTGSPQ